MTLADKVAGIRQWLKLIRTPMGREMSKAIRDHAKTREFVVVDHERRRW